MALAAAGGLAAALSTAAGLLLVISTTISRDLFKNVLTPKMTEKQELVVARVAAAGAVILAGHFGVNPPGFVAQVVAFAFGLAVSTFFSSIFMEIFFQRINKEGAISGMLTGLVFTVSYIAYFIFIHPEANTADNWLFGISHEGIGTVGMLLNFVVTIVVTQLAPRPPQHIRELVYHLRFPDKEVKRVKQKIS